MDGGDRILYVRDPDDAAAPEPAALGAEGLTVDAMAGLASLHEALADLLELVLSHTDTDRPTLYVGVRADDTTLTITADDCALPVAERKVLTGDIKFDQVRHAQGLGVRNVYWHVWYAGGSVDPLDDGVRVRLPPA